MLKISKISPLLAMLLLGACTTMPSGPSVLVLPGTGKNFDQFRANDFECRQFAQQQLGNATPGTAADDSGVRSAIVGTLLGAAVGGAINGNHGAAVGAGAGLAMGGLTGTGAAQSSAGAVQQRYDFAYQQCMYAKGHRVPVAAGSLMSFPSRQAQQYPAPPPPPGTPPPPPPR